MSLRDRMTVDMKAAMKAREAARRDTLRMLLSALGNERIRLQRDLDEAEEIDFLATQAKRRRESIDAYEQAERQELADQERAELAVIEEYLPKQLSEDEVRALVRDAIEQTGASSKKDMGRVMGAVMPQLRGRFPGAGVKPIVDSMLD